MGTKMKDMDEKIVQKWGKGRKQDLLVFREALQKTGVNIKPILLRLKDR